ncbi:MAG: hypothetical protein MRY83_22715, partial [Flavobacteriales bacterium]|nr:hypothetical protein [Flavobacteriales bacterium]
MKTLPLILIGIVCLSACSIKKSQQDCNLSPSINFNIYEFGDTIKTIGDELSIFLNGDSIWDLRFKVRDGWTSPVGSAIFGNDDTFLFVDSNYRLIPFLPGMLVQNCRDIDFRSLEAFDNEFILIRDSVTQFALNSTYYIGFGVDPFQSGDFKDLRYGYVKLRTLDDGLSLIIEKV